MNDYALYTRGLWPPVLNRWMEYLAREKAKAVYPPPCAWPIRIWKECVCSK